MVMSIKVANNTRADFQHIADDYDVLDNKKGITISVLANPRDKTTLEGELICRDGQRCRHRRVRDGHPRRHVGLSLLSHCQGDHRKKEQGTVNDGACEGRDFKDKYKNNSPNAPFPYRGRNLAFFGAATRSRTTTFPSPTCECNKKEQGTVSDGACEGGDFKDKYKNN